MWVTKDYAEQNAPKSVLINLAEVEGTMSSTQKGLQEASITTSSSF